MKACELLSFSKTIGKNIGQSVSENLRSKYSQKKILVMLNNLIQMCLKLLQKKQLKKLQGLHRKILQRVLNKQQKLNKSTKKKDIYHKKKATNY